jgi:uncharacterized protein YndB with AHSA1/START domain
MVGTRGIHGAGRPDGVREGGTSLVCMRTPDGLDMYNTWTYERIVPHQRLEFVHHFVDQDGRQLEPSALGLPEAIPFAVRHVLVFEARDGETELTVTEYGYASDEVVELSRMGMQQVLDKLARVVSAS